MMNEKNNNIVGNSLMERFRTKRLITHPAFIIIAAICALDWLSKAIFAFTLSNPMVPHQSMIITIIKEILGVPYFYKELFSGNLEWGLALVYTYGYWYDYLIAGTVSVAILLSCYLIGRNKFFFKGWLGKVGFGFLAGASLANMLEKVVTGKVINWLRISRFFNVMEEIPAGVKVSLYRQDKITNMADIIIYLGLPLVGIIGLAKLILWCNKRHLWSSLFQKLWRTIEFNKKVVPATLVIVTLVMLLSIPGCDPTSPEARYVFGVTVEYWDGPDPERLWWQPWMLDYWHPVGSGQYVILNGAEFVFYIKFQDNFGDDMTEPGIKVKAEVVGHYDSFNNYEPGGPQDHWETHGYLTTERADENGIAKVIVGLGDPEGNPGKEWPEYVATYVDIKLTVPKAQAQLIYLKAHFIDQYPTNKVWIDQVLDYSYQTSSLNPGIQSSGAQTLGTGTREDSLVIKLDNASLPRLNKPAETLSVNKETTALVPSTQTSAMNQTLSYDPNVVTYLKWGHLADGVFQDTNSINLIPIFFDPNTADPNTGFVDPSYIDPNDILAPRPVVAKITVKLPQPFSRVPDPNVTSTIFLRSIDDLGYPYIVMPIEVNFNEITSDRQYITGITQGIVPLEWSSPWYWTAGYFNDRVAISHLWYGNLDLAIPALFADFNLDDVVDVYDLATFSQSWLADAFDNIDNYEMLADYNMDGYINFIDFAAFAGNWPWQEGGTTMMSQNMSAGTTSQNLITVEPQQQRVQVEPIDIEEILKWLDEIWLTDEQLRKTISEDEWLKFMEALKE